MLATLARACAKAFSISAELYGTVPFLTLASLTPRIGIMRVWHAFVAVSVLVCTHVAAMPKMKLKQHDQMTQMDTISLEPRPCQFSLSFPS